MHHIMSDCLSIATVEVMNCFLLQIGPFGLLFMGIVTIHCMLQLLTCSKELCER